MYYRGNLADSAFHAIGTVAVMPSRSDRPWKVLESLQTFDGFRCVDIFVRANGTFGFEEFRRDPEDMGSWTALGRRSSHEYPSERRALEGARDAVSWLSAQLDDQSKP